MIACGTYIAKGKRRPCLHCNDFMMWGISVGYCDKTKKDMSCSNTCKKWNKYNPNKWLPYKTIYRHGIRYEIWKSFSEKTMYFYISKVYREGIDIQNEREIYRYNNPREAIRIIEIDAKRYEEV